VSRITAFINFFKNKKKLLAILIIIALVIVGIFITYLFYGVLNMIMFTGFEDPFLRIKVWKSNDTLVTSISCPKNYSWQVFEKDTVWTGNKFEDGGRVSSIQKHRYFQLVLSNKVLATISPSQVRGGSAYSDEFPSGDNIIRAYIFGSSTITREGKPDLLTQIIIFDSEISLSDFDSVIKCLYDNRIVVEQEVPQLTNSNIKTQTIGWALLLDRSVKNNTPNIQEGVLFKCKNGKNIATMGHLIKYTSPHQIFGAIGIDGVVYQASTLSVDWTKPISLQEDGCLDLKGRSLSEFLFSIPQRIIILP
jgi:hypothetical protein